MMLMNLPQSLLYGAHTLYELPTQLQRLHVEKPIIMYSGSAVNDCLNWLRDTFSGATFFEMPKGEPTLSMLDDAVQAIQQRGNDSVVAIGGGSAIDLAKAAAAVVYDQERDFMSFQQLQTFRRLPLIAIPTTAGTGAEATRITVIIDEERGMKLNPAHPDFIPDIAILDPELTVSMPAHITAFTALDALTHAIEAYVATNATVLSDVFALQAMPLITANIETAVNEPMNLVAREQLMLGSFYAGIAISNATTNLAHATGRVLGATYHLPHGQSVALTHPFVVERGLEAASERYDHVAKAMGLATREDIAPYLRTLNDKLHVWKSATSLANVLDDDAIAHMTALVATGNGLLTNRWDVTKDDIADVFVKLKERLQQ
ncbi:iron-containing alcohol dehydrogenase [Caryophanon latum]|uniref:Uncharacterized protein n=1 Tax=Caryophanon latum TaxID=33977 RepID=A0A1C0YUW3_9BACL|nr:iron-containing alcohol dehydrogenase [Caryophanon latum]OCS90977.1 hypothetical protein A6K76_10425 [Caryophanon latum]